MLPLEAGLILLAMLLGPSLSGLIATAILEGRGWLREIGARLMNWQVGAPWYAAHFLQSRQSC